MTETPDRGPLTLPVAQTIAVLLTAIDLGCTVERLTGRQWQEVVPRYLAGHDGDELPADVRDAVAVVELLDTPEADEPVGEGGGPLRRWPLADLVTDYEQGCLRLRL